MRGNAVFVGFAALLGLPGGVFEAVAGAQPAAASFESLLATASPSPDLPTMVAAFLADCGGETRVIDRARCASVSRHLRSQLPTQSFAMVIDDAAAVSVSDYDARIKGVRLGVVGCLACDEPIAVGKTGQQRMVTLKPPERAGRALAEAVEVVKASFAFAGIPEARLWLKQVRPHLRAEFVFAPEAQEWSFGPSRGFAFRMLGVRVFNRCTGEVVFSQPASAEPARARGDAESCAGEAEGDKPSSGLPDTLSAQTINRTMADMRPVIDKCLARYDLRGSVQLQFEVAGSTGIPQSVALQGGLTGTEAGRCLTDAARKLRFPRFARETQTFSYPVLLRRR